ncbi:SGNH/GDSL hydrolase family protein [Muricoccus pecuniae]|uniref:SGNH hydrolase-type esterase domain-containing protein n=1 Tax=Muricoccus pecuniae TaxID=693023 RepID=A0A840YHS6_9PROT|nr:hypothetical protein [Roseomonas pecuniae]MBB5695971.1 hypothetical protein [Roseomonas pecuniae]
MAEIALRELEQRMRTEHLTKDELQRYFETDPGASPAPFFPGLRIRTDVVAMPPPGPRTLGVGSGLARWIIRARREERDRWFTDKRRTDPNAKVVVSDGDSWFLHPLLYDVIDRLAGICAIKSLDWPGDELQTIASLKEYLPALEETGATVLLVSAGGNDLVANGKLADHLNEYAPGMTADKLLRPSYDKLIATSMRRYADIFRTALAVELVDQIVCHGYDYAIPGVNGEPGRWMERPMASRGIDDPGLRREIATIMVDRFNNALWKAAGGGQNLRIDYLDLRGTLGDHQWSDELHPKEDGFLAVAGRFRQILRI